MNIISIIYTLKNKPQTSSQSWTQNVFSVWTLTWYSINRLKINTRKSLNYSTWTYGCISSAQSGVCRPSCKSTVWWRQSSELLWEEMHTHTILKEKQQQKTANLFPCPLHEKRIWHVCKNSEHIQTLSPTLEGEEQCGPCKATHKTPRAPPTTAKESRRCTERCTHSSPWRAASSPPGPCLACCPPRSSCSTSHTQTQSRETHNYQKCHLGLLLQLQTVLSGQAKRCPQRLPDVFLYLILVQESVSHPPAALGPTENGSFKAAIKLPEWKPSAGFTHLAGRWEESVPLTASGCRLTRLAVCDISTAAFSALT